uniref:Helix-turn-helix domain-containing protein n=1 Tax=Eubacterium plexicaudatum ASF492 TaxID=1235802 RepID=N2ACT1_9FIRM
MAVFRVERDKGYTVMSNHHLRNKELTLKAKGLLSQMLSLPEDWDYTLAGLSQINREKIDAIREAIKELERAGYIVRSRERDEKGRLRGADYVIYEQPHTEPTPDLPTLENPTLDNPMQEKPMLEKPTLENPMQLNKDIQRTDLPTKEKRNTDLQSTHSIPIHSPNVILLYLFFQLPIVGVKAFFLRLQLFILCLQGGDAGELAADLRRL